MFLSHMKFVKRLEAITWIKDENPLHFDPELHFPLKCTP